MSSRSQRAAALAASHDPRVIVQSDDFAATASVTVCLLTSHGLNAPLLRLRLVPDAGNGLAVSSWIMVDKIMTAPRAKIGRRIGSLSSADLLRLTRALAVLLGIASA